MKTQPAKAADEAFSKFRFIITR